MSQQHTHATIVPITAGIWIGIVSPEPNRHGNREKKPSAMARLLSAIEKLFSFPPTAMIVAVLHQVGIVFGAIDNQTVL